MELDKALERVRKLIERAEHEGTGKAEADLCRAQADRLMEEYSIKEWQTAQQHAGVKPDRIRIDIGEGGSPFLTETAKLAYIIARFCRCEAIWMIGSGGGGYVAGRQEYCWVYGYQGDLKYFEMLYTTLFLHMSGAIFPKPDSAKSLGENVYAMRSAGMNFIDIAGMYGWTEVPSRDGEAKFMYRNKEGERASWSKTIGRMKAAYKEELKRLGEEPVKLAPTTGKKMQSEEFKISTAAGYLARLQQRFWLIQEGRGVGTELVLADRSHNITALINEYHQNLGTAVNRDVPTNIKAYSMGVAHANTANINPAAGSGSSPAIGA